MFTKLLLVLCFSGGAVLAADLGADRDPDWKLPEDRSLRLTLATIERGFAQESLPQLGSVFPRQEKVLVRWEDPIRHDGLLTGTQVILFLRELFLKNRTVGFKLQSGSLLPPGRLYHCMGRWQYSSSEGSIQKLELHFSLKEDAGVWTIRELRQTR